MINLNTFILYIFLLKFISFLIYFYFHKDAYIGYIYAFLFLIFSIYFFNFYTYKFTKYGILRRIDYFTQPLERIVPIIQKNRVFLSKIPELHNFSLCDFYIFSSHNTYVAGNQNLDVNSLKMLKLALQLGVREIELDVYAKNYHIPTKNFLEPVVTHGIESENGQSDIFLNSNILSFESCIDIISKYAFENNNDDPLIINIELNTHNIDYTNKRVYNILKEKFDNKLLISNHINNLRKIKIKDLIGKVIIIIHNLHLDSVLKDLSYDYYKNVSYNYINEISLEKTKEHLVRVFPPANLESHFSYNCDPVEAWNKGIQFSSCNIQVLDDNLKKHFKKFKKYSYVLKPFILRNLKKINEKNKIDLIKR